MKRKMLSLLLAVSVLILQMNIVTAATPAFTNTQSSTPTVTGNGIFIEAENCSYTNWYSKTSNSSASGKYALKATNGSKDSRGSSGRGELELNFKVQKAGKYMVWIRYYATSDSQDSLYSGFLTKGYQYTGLSTYNSFAWVKSDQTIQLSAGASATCVIYPRESGHLIDAIIVTSSNFTPTGTTGNIPEIGAETTLVSKYAPTPYQPPKEHPRVLFTSDDIQRIKTNMSKSQNKAAYEKFDELRSSSVTGNANGGYNERILREIESHAFDYVINGNKTQGQTAVTAIMKYLSTADPSASGNETRNGGNIMYIASEVYDWCYDLMTDAQRKTVISTCESYANGMEINWPPTSQGSVVGHGSEAQLLKDMLAFAIATYDERPDIWECVAGRFYEEYPDARNFFNKGHYALQGDSYGLYRHRWDTYSYLLLKGMGLPTNYDEEDLAQVGYSQIYLRRPDGQYMRDGDTSDDTTYNLWQYWSGYAQTYIVDSSIINDPYLKDEAFTMAPSGEACYYSSPIIFLVANNPDLPKASVRNLPKSRFFDDPAGVMVARTGWDKGVDTNDVVVEMKIGGVRQNNHQHYDAGHFQIYYKGILASDSGVYQGLYNDHSSAGGTDYNSDHRQNYMIRTIAHNSMLISDPSDKNNGSQRLVNNNSEPSKISNVLSNINEYRAATVLAQEIDPKNPIDPEYSYIKGDLANAYTNRASEFKRSFMFLNLFENEVPAALIVFDKVTSTDKTFKKTWLLHGVQKPIVNGTQTVFARSMQSSVAPVGYNGKMTVDTLLPKESDANIEIVGNEQDGFSIVNGVDITGIPSNSPIDEGNTYRMELSPKSQNLTDYFLNVIQVSDNDKNYYANTEIIENNLFYGAKIRNRAVMFSKSGTNVGSTFSITVPTTYKFTICDTKPGTWQVKSDEGKQQVIVGNGNVLAFEASGTITCTYLSSIGTQTIVPVVLSTDDECRIKIDDQFVNGEQLPELKNDTLMMSLTTFSKWYNIKVTAENGYTSLVKGNKKLLIKSGQKGATINGSSLVLQEAPYIKNGEMMVPVADFVDEFGGEYEWHSITKIAEITREVDASLPEGYATMVGVRYDSGEVDGENIPENAIDEDIDSIWAAKGVGRYFDIDLGELQKIYQVEVLFNPNGHRNAKFEVLVSEDGKNFTSVLSSTSDGSLESVMWEIFPLDEPVTARYVRYKGNGSNISNWNAIKEIRFRLYSAKLSYSASASTGKILVDTTDFNSKSTVFSALYDIDGRLTELKSATCNNGEIDLQMSQDKFQTAKTLKLFVWDTKSLTPYALSTLQTLN